MKWLFNKKRSNAVMITAWQKISKAINRKAHAWADYLNIKATKWSARKLKTMLVVLGGLWMAGSAFVVWHAMQSKGKAYAVTSVSIPRHVEQQKMPANDTAIVGAVNRIEHFKHWLDSLQQRGSPVYDSIVRARPGLIDSISFIEQYYSSKK